jgi:hypothetical protein
VIVDVVEPHSGGLPHLLRRSRCAYAGRHLTPQTQEPARWLSTIEGVPIRSNTSFDQNIEDIASKTVKKGKSLSSKEIGIMGQATSNGTIGCLIGLHRLKRVTILTIK